MLALHRWKLLSTLLTLNLILIATLIMGTVKTWGDIDWLDILGEGSVTLMALVWWLFTLNNRPAGAVTNWLALGLGLLFLGTFQDVVDEVVALPEGHFFRGGLESTLTPCGLILLTVGLFHWQREQRAFNLRERKREQFYREYRLQDQLTGLGDARYLQQQLPLMTERAEREGQPFALLLLDIDHFSVTNRQYGSKECDRLLRELSELLLLNLRRCDLLCRYAGDRFAILMPSTGQLLAREQAQQLANAVQHFAYKTAQGESLFHTASVGLALNPPTAREQLLTVATHSLLQAKEAQAPRQAA
ncbi:GGDEF domain-containing protein [Marinimicrobium agarilyticum]|uniref:GGDEF domain-containing protein n=1 Tax=Marinimicrobium agarilyticum TaxID=306546 RepID=UPI000403BB91|nr:GGDEF domain-containing protein [Marinimicrobium agarilyticum]